MNRCCFALECPGKRQQFPQPASVASAALKYVQSGW